MWSVNVYSQGHLAWCVCGGGGIGGQVQVETPGISVSVLDNHLTCTHLSQYTGNTGGNTQPPYLYICLFKLDMWCKQHLYVVYRLGWLSPVKQGKNPR